MECDAGLRGEFGEGLVGERFLFRFFHGDVGHVHAVARDAGTTGGFLLLGADNFLETVESIAAPAELRNHAAGHFRKFGGGLFDSHVIDGVFERLDFLMRGFDGKFTSAQKFLVGLLGGFGLSAIFLEVATEILETQSVLRGDFLVGGFEMRHGLGAEVAFLLFLAFDLRDEAFAKAGVSGEAGVIFADLFAEIFLFDFEQRLGIFAFDAGNEEAQEATNQVGHSLDHNDMRFSSSQDDSCVSCWRGERPDALECHDVMHRG